MPDEIMDKLLDFKKPAYNTDNMGKLFVTVFAFLPAACLPVGRAGRCSCTQDKFVIEAKPGFPHLHAIKILHLDYFLAKVPGPDSYRDCPDASSGNTPPFIAGPLEYL